MSLNSKEILNNDEAFKREVRVFINNTVFEGDLDLECELMNALIELFDEGHGLQTGFVQALREQEPFKSTLTPGEIGALGKVYQKVLEESKKRVAKLKLNSKKTQAINGLSRAIALTALSVVAAVALYYDEAMDGTVEAAKDSWSDTNTFMKPELEKMAGRKVIDMWNEKFWIDVPGFIENKYRATPNFADKFERDLEKTNAIRKMLRENRRKTDDRKDIIADKVEEFFYQRTKEKIDEHAKEIAKFDNADDLIAYLKEQAEKISGAEEESDQ